MKRCLLKLVSHPDKKKVISGAPDHLVAGSFFVLDVSLCILQDCPHLWIRMYIY